MKWAGSGRKKLVNKFVQAGGVLSTAHSCHRSLSPWVARRAPRRGSDTSAPGGSSHTLSVHQRNSSVDDQFSYELVLCKLDTV
ncbi:hypothetical protein LSTR_LSTR008356 [Laodelphax striatellus]|uniref:Uncharacterized protein n=1 Tax=Laodelphax striatellus TaxID=195883 RepID=A0A482XUZ2_LAOST|nr:hypothetical protein LSTR_LSTR008356 [Laodelphax striatellus]